MEIKTNKKLIIHETDSHGCGCVYYNGKTEAYAYDDCDIGDIKRCCNIWRWSRGYIQKAWYCLYQWLANLKSPRMEWVGIPACFIHRRAHALARRISPLCTLHKNLDWILCNFTSWLLPETVVQYTCKVEGTQRTHTPQFLRKEVIVMYSRVIVNELGEIEEYVSDLTGAEVEEILEEHPEWKIKCIPID